MYVRMPRHVQSVARARHARASTRSAKKQHWKKKTPDFGRLARRAHNAAPPPIMARANDLHTLTDPSDARQTRRDVARRAANVHSERRSSCHAASKQATTQRRRDDGNAASAYDDAVAPNNAQHMQQTTRNTRGVRCVRAFTKKLQTNVC